MSINMFESVKVKIARALADRKGSFLTGSSVAVVAVTKNHPPEIIELAHAGGFKLVGENRVQEALHKQRFLTEQGKVLPGLEWHLLGHLQSNKVRQAVGAFDLIESVDSLRLLELIDREALRIDKMQQVLLQVNVAAEPQKTGFSQTEFCTALEHLSEFPNVKVLGMMVIAPATENPELVRPVFRKGYDLFCRLSDCCAADVLSMGMSGDFEVAVEEGANQVRLGRILFGERDYSLKF